jgi:hypothetical protein
VCSVAFTILAHKTADLEEQCTCLIFYVKLGRKGTPAFEVLKIDFEDIQWEEHKFLSNFPKLNGVWHLSSISCKVYSAVID